MHTDKAISILYFSTEVIMFYLIVLVFNPGLFSSVNAMELLADEFVSLCLQNNQTTLYVHLLFLCANSF